MSFLKNRKMKFLHASLNKLEVGTVLRPRDDYEERWGNTDFYKALERYRPKHMLSHKESVFMCHSAEDLDNCIGGEYIFEVIPDTRIEKHDLNWSSEVSCLVCDNAPEEKIKQAALNYWNGIPHPNESIWEYLTPKAIIKKVYLYDEYEDEFEIKQIKKQFKKLKF
jgi:hypothetical protein